MSGYRLTAAQKSDAIERAQQLRERLVAAGPESVEADLLRQLQAIPHVKAVRTTWFHGYLDLRVVLDGWVWDAWDAAHDLIDDFGREHVSRFSVVGHVEVPEDHP